MGKSLIWLVFGILVAATAWGAEGQIPVATEAWTASFEKDIVWQRLTDAGYLLVCTDDGLFGLNPETGAVAWRIEDVKKIPDDYIEVVDGTQFAIVTKKSGPLGTQTETVLLDVTNGHIQWTSKEIGIANAQGQFLYAPTMALVMYGQMEKTLKPVTVMADLATGRPIWTNNTLFKKPPVQFTIRPEKKSGRMSIKGNQPPLALNDGHFMEFWSPAGPRKIEATTGNVLWTSPLKFKEIPALRNGYAPFVLSEDGQTAFIPHDNTIDAINTSDGSLRWAKSPKLLSKVVQMQLTPQGLVLRGAAGPKSKPYITVLDPATGLPTWKKPFRDLKGASSFAVKGDKIAIYADETIFLINIADGSFTEAAKKIEFSGGEIPSTLELLDDGYLLISDQNMMRLDGSGKVVYHAYHKAPGTSLLAKVASTAAIAAVNAASAASAYSKAMETGMDQKYTLITSNPVMSKRFKATAMAGGSVTVLTKVEAGGDSGPGLVKVDKATGADVKCVVLGTKKPEYEMDDIENRLFFMKDDRTIVCYSF